jgi:hypothetical protein
MKRVGSNDSKLAHVYSTRHLGPLITHTRVPKLAELALRIVLRSACQRPRITPLSFANHPAQTPNTAPARSLFTPTDSRSSVFSTPSHPSSMPLSDLGPAPYNSHPFPPHTLLVSDYYDMTSWLSEGPRNTGVYIAAAMHGTEDARNLYSWCPGYKHREDEESDNAHSGLFVQPTEERLEWVTLLAGCELPSAVPILWRGCSAGCLDFLEGNNELTARNQRERDEDEEFMTAFGNISRNEQSAPTEEEEEAAVEAQTQIVWDDMMDLDDLGAL